jgi:hypothetical protein
VPCLDCAKPVSKRSIRCIVCSRKYRKENKVIGKEYLREWTLKKKYGISTEEFNEMFNELQGKCEICDIEMQMPISKIGGQPNNTVAVDHDHNTKKIRGLLCISCNFLLGRFEKNTNQKNFFSVDRAIQYLGKESK